MSVSERTVQRTKESTVTHVELLRGERSTTDASGVRLDDTDRLGDPLGRDTEASADTSDRGRRRCDVRVRSKVEVQHERIGTLDEDLLVLLKRDLEEADAVDDHRAETLGEGLVWAKPVSAEQTFRHEERARVMYLVAGNLALGVILEVSVPLEAALDELAELGCKKLRVVEVVDTETGTRGLGRIGGPNAHLGGSNAGKRGKARRHVSKVRDDRCEGRHSRRSTELDLLEAVNNLVEVKDEVGPVGDEEPALAVEAWQEQERQGRK